MFSACGHYDCVAILDLKLNAVNDYFAFAFLEPEELVYVRVGSS